MQGSKCYNQGSHTSCLARIAAVMPDCPTSLLILHLLTLKCPGLGITVYEHCWYMFKCIQKERRQNLGENRVMLQLSLERSVKRLWVAEEDNVFHAAGTVQKCEQAFGAKELPSYCHDPTGSKVCKGKGSDQGQKRQAPKLGSNLKERNIFLSLKEMM